MKKHFVFDRINLVAVVDEVTWLHLLHELKCWYRIIYEEREKIKITLERRHVYIAKDKVEIICHFTVITRASCSHDNMQSHFILLEDNCIDMSRHNSPCPACHCSPCWIVPGFWKPLGSTMKNCMSHRESQGIRHIPTAQHIRISIN